MLIRLSEVKKRKKGKKAAADASQVGKGVKISGLANEERASVAARL